MLSVVEADKSNPFWGAHWTIAFTISDALRRCNQEPGGLASAGARVNIFMLPDELIGLVLGHMDVEGRYVSSLPSPRSLGLSILLMTDLLPYIAHRGLSCGALCLIMSL